MADNMQTEPENVRRLVTSREPSGGKKSGPISKDAGGQALTDALIMIGIAWAILFFLMFSLRHTNI